jgi:hypothetical protein
MSVKLEKYLKVHRESMDTESPDDSAIWEGIQDRLINELPADKHLFTRTRLIRFRNLAAAAIILFSIGYITNDLLNGRSKSINITLSSISNELGRREKEYKNLVNFKTVEVSSFSGSANIEIKELFDEIKLLDLIYSQAITDLKELGPNEKVINTIFNTYEQKIRLLEIIILETNKSTSHENDEKSIL